MRLALAFVLFAVGTVVAVDAQAGGPIAVESHVGERSDDSRAVIEPVLDELSGRGFRVGAGQVGIEAERISRPASSSSLDVRELATRAQEGINAWNTGAIDEAAEKLQRLWVDVRLNPAPVALDNTTHEPLYRALVTLAMVRARVKAEDTAFDVMAEVIRSFPDRVVTKAAFGPEAARLYDSTRKTLNQQGRGTLKINVADGSVQVFVNERYASNGATTRTDLIPGHYRVYLQRGDVEGRYYIANVTADAETVVDVDWPFDAALQTGPYWAGFLFANERDRGANESLFAVRLAARLDAPLVIVLSVGKLKGKTALIGTTYETATHTAKRSASIAISPAPPDDRLRAFARFLAGDPAVEGFEIVEPGAGAPRLRDDAAGYGWVKWTLAGTAVASIAAGVYLISIHGDGACSAAPDECPDNWNTAPGGIALVGTGLLAGGTATYLFIREHRRTPNGVAIVPRVGGTFVMARWSF